MSDQPPRTPFTPLYTPELSRDSNGNRLYRDQDGRWLPYNRLLPNQQQAMPEQTPQSLGHVPLNDRSRGGPNSPIEQVFQPQPQYHFSLRPVQSNTPQHSIPVDPALMPLPGGADLDLRDGPTIANAIGLKRAEKVAGSRRKGKERADPKGKKRQRASSDSEGDSEPVAKRGRPAGSGNYGKEDVNKLFELIEEELPVGQKGWKVVVKEFNKWAKKHGRPKRVGNALENKYKQYLKQKKPTGDAACPPEVKRAHELEDLINQRVGTRYVSDSEFDDSDGSSENDVEVVERPSAAVRTAVARRNPTPPLRRKSRANGTDLANKLASVFDPDVQKARDNVRSQRAFENTQLLALSQQVRDAQAVAESLRTQNGILQNRINDLERARERDELRQEMLELARGGEGTRGRSRRRSRRRNPISGYRSHKRDPGIQRVNGKIRCETKYPDGGAMTYWVSDPSTDDYYDDNEENNDPWDTFEIPDRSHSRRMDSRRPISRRRTPMPGPSHLPALPPSPSPPLFRIPTPYLPAQAPEAPAASIVGGNAVELVVTPRRGPAVALVISPAKQPNDFNGN
ncbi:hypothetical protein DFH08DRAFT_968688 [Mycena albidolilacea]|uniref:DUF6818 domain-containing protein n=1 Tax=Mycena albidolilacea TaxID=1033008 RepID=A0AAD7EIT5_9AGAR|nr:hypothetical protein DFH08DRAFT_968688 [Mycena albidolilacea]